jgi:steroid 5-alpha reductase family enzyme
VKLDNDHPSRSLALTAVVYAVALLIALVVGALLRGRHPLAVVAAADLAATIVVFGFSVRHDNSSLYDPYWSVAPVPIAVYLALAPAAASPSVARQIVVLLLVGAWAVRLTYNWASQWQGLGHEDWRYVDIRHRSGRAYWLVSFVGIHLFPTVMVFGGCLALYPALTVGQRPFGWVDVVAVVATASAIVIEATADRQLRRFKDTGEGGTLTAGLWAHSRHPNYFGENLFWWGLFLFGLAADPSHAWTIVGPLAITTMFLVVSIPMIDRRMLVRRPEYAEVMRKLPALIPWSPRE